MTDKTILVTGGCGFIGSHYLNMAVKRYSNYQFINVDLLTYASSQEYVVVSKEPNYHFVQADIRDRKTLEEIFSTHQPTHLINFAAESHVDNSITRPQEFIETNILGVHNLLDLARIHTLARFHQVSTDEVYGSIDEGAAPVTEDAPLLPNSPYSASKASGDLLVRAYHRTFGIDTIITRASNNYGPHQHTEKLIPRFITSLLKGKKVPLYGSGLQVRDWIFVGDHVQGIDRAFHQGMSGHIYNLGGKHELRNTEITELLLTMGGFGQDRIEHVPDRLGHDFRYAIDSSKAEKELDWRPSMNFTAGLQVTWDYYAGRI